MSSIKILSLSIIGILIFIISLTLIKFILKKSKITAEKKLTLSYSIWIVCLLISFSIIDIKTINVFGETLDIIYKTNLPNPIFEIIRSGAVFTAISCIWFWISYIFNNYITILLLGKRKNSNEMDNDNYLYFLVKGIALISFVSCLFIVFEGLLRTFVPNINTPFYH